MQLRALFVVGLALSTGGCVVTSTEIVRTHPSARGGSPSAPSQGVPGAEHVVERGETLYAIAFRRGVDWRDLASWNGLGAPYTIYPGQRLRLGLMSTTRPAVADTGGARPSSSSTAGPASSSQPLPDSGVETRPLGDGSMPAPTNPRTSSSTNTTTAPGTTGGAVSSTGTPGRASTPAGTAGSPASRAGTPVATAPTTPAGSGTQPVRGVPDEIPAPLSPAPAPLPRDENAPTSTVAGIRWRWPTQGEIIQRYTNSDLTRQGIGIAGRSGQAVVAAADGEVVYSGSGLRGYGELIIIKHSGDFLSAYGHNRKRLVAEGQRVQAGEPVAELGRTGTDRDKLHFEIRRSGKPVDPMQFLPRR